MIKRGDTNHELIKKFLQSLPQGSKNRFRSKGYQGHCIGNLVDNRESLNEDHKRDFAIFRVPNQGGINKEYFNNVSGTGLIRIKDELQLKISVRHYNSAVKDYKRMYSTDKGNIDRIVHKYIGLLKKDPAKLLWEQLKEPHSCVKNFTKHEFDTKIMKVTEMVIGLSTTDEEYLLKVDGLL